MKILLTVMYIFFGVAGIALFVEGNQELSVACSAMSVALIAIRRTLP